MNKIKLINFFRGEASEQDANDVIDWINKSQSNREYFAKEKELWTMINFVNETPDSSNFNQIMDKINSSSMSSKEAKRKNIFRISYFSAAAVIVVLLITNIAITVFGGGIFGNLNQGKQNLAQENKNIGLLKQYDSLSGNNKYSLYTDKGIKAAITLPDGSKVWLNSDTRIEYPKKFSDSCRDVVLDGEAYFEVVKNPSCPMRIRTNKNFVVEVLGTTLSVKSYYNETKASATLFSGEIKLHYGDKDGDADRELYIKPNETCQLSGDSSSVEVVKLVTEKKVKDNIAWKNGELLFDNTPMEDVIKMLERWHGTKFEIKNQDCFKYTLSASFESESIVQVMEIVKLCIPINYTINKNSVKIY